MASNRFHIPSANDFFEGLLSLMQQCGDRVNENTDGAARRISCKTSIRHSHPLYFPFSLITDIYISIYYIDTSVLLENIPLVKFIKTTSGTRVVYFP